MERAYDQMYWDFVKMVFVEMMFLRIGFCQKFVWWITGCVRDSSFAIWISGTST